MKTSLVFFLSIAVLISCTGDKQNEKHSPMEGTWQLLSAKLVEKGDTAITDYTKNIRMIKIINATHFAFLNHDLKNGKDSTGVFVAGGGRYTLVGDQYTEFLEYCSDRDWEGHHFQFSITIRNDTLTQKGTEKLEGKGIERLNIEKYVKLRE